MRSITARPARLLVAALSLLLLSACSLPRGAALQSEILRETRSEEPSFQVVPVTRATVPGISQWPATGWSGSYTWLPHSRGPASSVIRSGDRVDLLIWDSQDNSLLTSAAQKTVQMPGLQVSPSGTIFVPYVEDVVVRGLTPEAARERVQSELEMIVPSAQVQLTATSGQENSVDLVGGVGKPGTYPLPSRDFTILSLLAQGGGISPEMENPLVRLIRGSNTYAVRSETLFADASLNTTMRGGDKVIVEPDRRRFTALGATGREALIPFPSEELTAMEALSLIGGISDSRADPQGILVLREYPADRVGPGRAGPEKSQVIFTLDLTTADGLFAARNFQINPDDTVLATESPITKAQTILGLFGRVLGLSAQTNALSN